MRLLGSFIQRDSVTRVSGARRERTSKPLAAVMKPTPCTPGAVGPFEAAAARTHKLGLRRVLVVEHGRRMGVAFARNADDPDLEDVMAETRRRDRCALTG